MRRARVIVTTAAAGAVLVGAAVAGPALAAGGNGAGPGDGTASWTCPMGRTASDGGYGMGPGMRDGTGPGPGRGMGPGGGYGMGPGGGYGMGDPARNLPAQGTLTTAQKATLAAMAEEEKLAHDVYVALARTSGDVRFTRIANAETRHLAAVRVLLTRYGVADPTAGKADGVFATAAVQKQYRDFVARGDDSLAAALAVGRDIEKADISELTAARSGLSAPDVLAVYDRLTTGSRHHLAAFSR